MGIVPYIVDIVWNNLYLRLIVLYLLVDIRSIFAFVHGVVSNMWK
jgi:hypothetical protein